jgi:hypothetical protein
MRGHPGKERDKTLRAISSLAIETAQKSSHKDENGRKWGATCCVLASSGQWAPVFLAGWAGWDLATDWASAAGCAGRGPVGALSAGPFPFLTAAAGAGVGAAVAGGVAVFSWAGLGLLVAVETKTWKRRRQRRRQRKR